MQILRKILDHFLLALNILSVVLLLCSAYSHRISPEQSTLSVFFGLLFPVFLLLNIGFSVFWIFNKNKWYTLLPVSAMILCGSSIHNFCPVNIWNTQTEKEETTVSILSYNVHYFDNYKAHSEKSPNEIIDYIKKQDADIVCLQEFGVFKKEDGFITEQQIRKALPQYKYYHCSPKSEWPKAKIGMACLSKYPITKVREVELSRKTYNGSSLYEINIKGEKIALLNNHLESNRFTETEKKMYRNTIKNLDLDHIDSVKQQLMPKLGKAAKTRAQQADHLAKIIAEYGDKIIVCGDFNDTPMSYIYHTIRGNMKDAYVEIGFGPGITYHENGFWFRIDHLLYGNAFRAIDARIGNEKYSDHYPLHVTLSIKKTDNPQ